MGLFGFYYDEPWVIMLLIIATAFAGYAQMKVSSTFNKYSKVTNSRGMTGEDAARQVLRNAGITDVTVERIAGNLTDHFDPRSKVIRLSDSVHSSRSVAALGVAAHEAGHAVQYANGYLPIKLRSAIIPLTQFGSNLAFPLILLGFFMANSVFINLGILLFSTMALFQLVTLPVEFNASSRAIVALENSHILNDDELKMAKKTLSAAALTYVAALAVSIVNLIRIMVRFGGNRDD